MSSGNNRCLDCRWCVSWVDSYGGTHYNCDKTHEFVSAAVVGLMACEKFEPDLNAERRGLPGEALRSSNLN